VSKLSSASANIPSKKTWTEVVHVVPNWMYRSGTGGGPKRDIVICVVPKWTDMEVDHPLVPNASGTERDLPLYAPLFVDCNCICLQSNQIPAGL